MSLIAGFLSGVLVGAFIAAWFVGLDEMTKAEDGKWNT